MLSRILILFLSAFSFESFAQNIKKFEILSFGNKYSYEEISSAFTNADLCGYFKNDSNTEFILDDSSVVRLRKKEELEQNGVILNPDCYNVKMIQNNVEIWRITNSVLVCEKIKSNVKNLNH